MADPSRLLTPRMVLLQEQRYRRNFLAADARQNTWVVITFSCGYSVLTTNDFQLAHGPGLCIALLGRLLAAGLDLISVAIILYNPRAVILGTVRNAGIVGLLGLAWIGIASACSFTKPRRKRFEAERQERQARKERAIKLRELAIQKDRAAALSRARTTFLAAMRHDEFESPSPSSSLQQLPRSGTQRF